MTAVVERSPDSSGQAADGADTPAPPAGRGDRRPTKPRRLRALRVAVALGIVAVGALFFTFFRLPPHLILDTGGGTAAAGPVTSKTVFIQPLTLSGRSHVTAVEVLLATWGRPSNDSYDRLTVYNERGTTVATESLPPGSIVDNAYHRIPLPSVDIGGGSHLYVALSSANGSEAKSHSITAWSNASRPQSPFYVLMGTSEMRGSPVANLARAHPHAGSLSVRLYGLGPTAVAAQRALAVGGLLVCLAAAAFVAFFRPRSEFLARARARLTNVSAASAYLAVALVWGLLLCVVIPPFQQFDEITHFQRAWALSAGQVTADGQSRVTVPTAVVELPTRVDYGGVGEGLTPYSVGLGLNLLHDTSLGPPQRIYCSATDPDPLGYLPAAAGIGAIRLLGLSPLAALYAARIANLLVAALLVFFAIRLLPFGRPMFVLVGLLPMTVTQFAAVNPDALTIAGAMLFLAAVLRLSRSSGIISTVTLALFAGGGMLLLNVKPGYAAFAFLGFLIPWKAFGSRRRWIVSLGALVATTFGLTLVNLTLLPKTTPAYMRWLYGAGTKVNEAAQTRFVLSHPFAFLQALRTTGGTGLSPIGASMVGILGRGHIPLSQMAVFLVLVTLIATLVATRDGPALDWWGRGLVLAVCAATTLGLSLALYIGSTNVGAGAVLGLQGRYFIPVLAVGLFAIYGLRRPPRWVIPVALVAIATALALSTLISLLRFYY
jgi:uncharacterized membrane protein